MNLIKYSVILGYVRYVVLLVVKEVVLFISEFKNWQGLGFNNSEYYPEASSEIMLVPTTCPAPPARSNF